jgi:N-acyl-D-amino-acid deacylase
MDHRGSIKGGMWADVVVFDDDKPWLDRSANDQPTLSPVGIDYVLLNVQVVIDHGKHTGARSGKVLYGPGRETEHANTL